MCCSYPSGWGFPLLWSLSQRRSVAALVSAGYFLAASRGLPQGVAHSIRLTFGRACCSGCVLPELCHGSCRPLDEEHQRSSLSLSSRRRHHGRPAVRYHGLGASRHRRGCCVSGMGMVGSCAYDNCLAGLVTRIWPAVVIALTGFWLWSAAFWTEPKLPEGWHGVDLEMGASLGREASLRRQRDLIATVRHAVGAGAGFVVLPESALGFWTPTIERLWTGAFVDRDTTVIAGAAVVDTDGYDNVLVAIDRKGSRILYRERMPVPGSMWQPWRSWFGESGGVRADFFCEPDGLSRCWPGRTADLLRATDRLGRSSIHAARS